MSVVDVAKLQDKALVDSNIWLSAIKDANPKKLAESGAFLKGMQANKKIMYLAAPALAELNIGASPGVPAFSSVVVVDFDLMAANLFGKLIPSHAVLKKGPLPFNRHFIKYDSMILACAIRHKASCLVTYDENLQKLAGICAFPWFEPSAFMEAQQSLGLQVAAPPSQPTPPAPVPVPPAASPPAGTAADAPAAAGKPPPPSGTTPPPSSAPPAPSA